MSISSAGRGRSGTRPRQVGVLAKSTGLMGSSPGTHKLCDRFGLEVTVCHYPPGCSKRNPVEHRLFSQISRNWAGKPLWTLSIMLAYIRGTTTTTGLQVTARLDEGVYPKGQKVTRQDLEQLNLRRHDTHLAWNYSLSPRHSKAAVLVDPAAVSGLESDPVVLPDESRVVQGFG
jgi:hypothetical protein